MSMDQLLNGAIHMGKKNKAIKPVVTTEISDADRKQMKEIYKIRSHAVNGVFITPFMQDKSTTVRLTFFEMNFTLQESVPVSAVTMTLEDVVNIYNAFGTLLQQMKGMGRIA